MPTSIDYQRPQRSDEDSIDRKIKGLYIWLFCDPIEYMIILSNSSVMVLELLIETLEHPQEGADEDLLKLGITLAKAFLEESYE